MTNLFHPTHILMTDEELVHGTARGNDLYYAELMRRYMRSVYEFVCQYVTAEEAERVTEQTFYTFWKSIDRFSHERTFRRWLFTIAKNIALHVTEEKSLLPSHVLHIPLPRGYQLEIQRISLLELADQMRSPLATLRSWEESFRSWAIPLLLNLKQVVQGRFVQKLPSKSGKFKLALNTYRV
jgi:hypothetical protein